jgi:hypothetical protein
MPIHFLAISGDSKHFSFFPEKKPKQSTPPGVPQIFSPQILFFCALKPLTKFQNPYDNPFLDKSNPAEEREEK